MFYFLSLIAWTIIQKVILSFYSWRKSIFFFWWLDKTQRIFRVVEVLCMIPWWWIHVIKHLSKPRGYTTPRENPTVNCGLKVMVCQWRIIGCNTGTIWGRVFTMGGGCLQWGSLRVRWAGGAWDSLIPSFQFCYEPVQKGMNYCCTCVEDILMKFYCNNCGTSQILLEQVPCKHNGKGN